MFALVKHPQWSPNAGNRRTRAVQHHLVTDSPERLTYTIAETAEMLGLSVSTLRRYVRKGELRSVKLGVHPLIPRVAIDEWLAGQTESETE